jgi:hypothetical protein
MPKFLSLIVAAGFALSVVGCGDAPKTDKKDPPKAATGPAGGAAGADKKDESKKDDKKKDAEGKDGEKEE